jgi:hypothetical protein
MSDKPSSERPRVAIKPVKRKIGEGPKNLRRREEWFQRRAGGRPRRKAT